MHNHSFWIPPDNTTPPHHTPLLTESSSPSYPSPALPSRLCMRCISRAGSNPSPFRLKDGAVGAKKCKPQNHQSFLVPNSSVGDHADLFAKVQGNWPFQIRLEHQMQGSKVVLLYLLDWAAQCQACSWTELKWTIWPLGKTMLKRVLQSFRTFRKKVLGFNNCKLS